MTYIPMEDAALIVEAINNLKQEQDYFKDYVLPLTTLIIGSIISAVLAYLISRRINDRAESIKLELSKIDATNYYSLQAEFCLQKLINIKSHYFGRLTPNSYQRVLDIPPLLDEYALPRTRPITDLIFISPSSHEIAGRWNQLTFINMMFVNYDSVVNWIHQRNDLRVELIGSYIEEGSKVELGGIVSDFQTGLDYLGRDKMVKLVTLTELIVCIVDDLILYFDEFINEFHTVARGKLKTEMPKGMKIILDFGSANANHERNVFKKREPEFDPQIFANLSGMSLKEVKEYFKSTYKQSN
jgi:hypothetical protein